MLNTQNSDGSQASESLYTWWLNAVPTFFAGASASKPGAVAGDTPPAPPGLGQVPEALDMARQLLTPMYEAGLKALLAQPQPGLALGVVLEQARERLHAFSQSLASVRQAMPAPPGMPWLAGKSPGDAFSAMGDALGPMLLNFERTYGGLADAFGLADSREMQQAVRELMASAWARRQAQAEYLAIVAGALAKGVDATMARLREMGQGGDSVDSFLGLVRVWAAATDQAMHAAMQTPDALDASARLLRASTGSRRQLQRVMGTLSAMLSVPTRAEVDEAYREIQELKREVRRLRKASLPAGVATVVRREEPARTTQTPRRRPSAAKTTKSRKAVA
jgi:hypothetical protein